jgi:hypothetical protein
VPGHPPLARRAEPGGPEDPPDRRAADGEALDLGELLGQVHVVEAGVLAPREGDDLGAERGGEGVRGRPSAVAMLEGSGAASPKLGAQPTDLAPAEPQGLHGLLGGDRARFE